MAEIGDSLDDRGGTSRSERSDLLSHWLYRRHRQGAVVRSGASTLVALLAVPAYGFGLLSRTQLIGIGVAVLYLILMNAPALWVAKRLKTRAAFDSFSIVVNGFEILGYTAVIHFVGGIEAAFVIPVYCGVIAYVGVVAPRHHPFLAAALSSAAFAGMVVLENLGWIQRYGFPGAVGDPPVEWSRVVVVLAVVAMLLFVVAYISARTSTALKLGREAVLNRSSELEREVQRRMTAEKRLLALLEEKELLLKEIHHRVKNNLQVVSSLLRLQARQIEDSKGKDALIRSQDRIRSMARIHQMFYRSEDLGRIDLASYCSDLASNIGASCLDDHGAVRIDVEVDSVEVSLDMAIPVGLILQELTTNALEHGYPDGASGTTRIRMRRCNESIELVVEDDGVGMPGGVNLDEVQTLGLHLVSSLCAQLGAEKSIESNGGTRFLIKIPLPDLGQQVSQAE